MKIINKWILLAVVLGLFFIDKPALAQQNSFASAQLSFERLPSEDRYFVPLSLAALGFYNGMSTGEFNRRIMRAIQEYQSSIGQPPTGVLLQSQLKSLERAGALFFAKIGLKEVSHPTTSSKLFVPLKLLPHSNRTARGISFEADDDSISVDYSFYSYADISFRDLFSRLSTPSSERQITYSVIRSIFFVIAGKYRGRDFYSRYQISESGTTGFTLAWNVDRLPAGANIAVLMSNLLSTGEQMANTSQKQNPSNESNSTPKKKPQISTGTGFFISDSGHLLTNNHVVDKCAGNPLAVKWGAAKILSRDKTNDLALLKVEGKTSGLKFRSSAIKLGEKTYALGYPYAGKLDNGLNITDGLVSSLSGPDNDIRYLQITAPVQPGNSGGPLIDSHDLVVGIVSARLNELAMLKDSGALPQNINFAIRNDLILSFLRSNAIEPESAATDSTRTPSEIAEAGRSQVVQIICIE
jgi:S1-C subfamily serine protease